jgi:hypothetical protein
MGATKMWPRIDGIFSQVCFSPDEGAVTEAAPATDELNIPADDDKSDALSFDSLESLLTFDPMKPSDKKDVRPEESEAEPEPESEPAAEPADGDQEVEPAMPEPAAPEVKTSPELDTLRQQNADLVRRLEALERTPAREPAAAAQPPGNEAERLMTQYAMSPPDGLMNLLGSEDAAERKQGIAALMTGLGAAVHQRVMAEVTRHLSQVPQVVDTRIASRNAQQSAYSDFYGTYKALDRAELRSMVVDTATLVAREKNLNNWNQDLRDETARRIYAVLGWKFPGSGGDAPQRKPNTPAQPRTLGSTSRPASAGAGNSSATQRDVMDTLFPMQT